MTSKKIIDLNKYQSAHREKNPLRTSTEAPQGKLISLEATLKARTALAIERARQHAEVGLARSGAVQGEVMFTSLHRVAHAHQSVREFSIDPMVIAKRLLDRLLPDAPDC